MGVFWERLGRGSVTLISAKKKNGGTFISTVMSEGYDRQIFLSREKV
jgi:hypothetical protein